MDRLETLNGDLQDIIDLARFIQQAVQLEKAGEHAINLRDAGILEGRAVRAADALRDYKWNGLKAK